MRTYVLPLIAGTLLLLSSCHKHDDVADEPTIETLEASDVTAHAAVLSARVSSFPSGTLYGFEYSFHLDFPEEMTRAITASSDAGKLVVPVKMLAPGRKYYYRAYAILPEETLFGSIGSFTTLESPCPEGGVDMGLSVYWAECNLGADKFFESGDLFAWGETETKDEYTWDTYKWCSPDTGSYSEPIEDFGNNQHYWYELTKYNIWNNTGPVDGKTELDPEDDPVRVHLGNGWRMPTREEMEELIDSRNSSMVYSNHKEYYMEKPIDLHVIVSRITGRQIELPSYYITEGHSLMVNNGGLYLTSSLYTEEIDSFYRTKKHACCSILFVTKNWINVEEGIRCEGYPIRPVHD